MILRSGAKAQDKWDTGKRILKDPDFDVVLWLPKHELPDPIPYS